MHVARMFGHRPSPPRRAYGAMAPPGASIRPGETVPSALGETRDGSTVSYANPSGRSFVVGAVIGAVAGAPVGAVLGAVLAAVRSEPIVGGLAKGAGVGAATLGIIAGGYWATHDFQ